MYCKIKFVIIGILAFVSATLTASSETGLELQKQADILREEGKSLRAIDTYNKALVSYQEAKDYPHMIGALTGRLLSWKHLFYKTQDRIYAIIVKKEAEVMLEIVNEHRFLDKMYLIHFLNGTSAVLLQDYPSAEKSFSQALELYPADNAEKGDWLAHLGDAVYRNGRKEEGKKMILEGVEIIKQKSSQIDSFTFNVWASGAYLRLAKLLKTDNLVESKLYLDQAAKIINSDDRLVIRKQQLEDYIKNS